MIEQFSTWRFRIEDASIAFVCAQAGLLLDRCYLEVDDSDYEHLRGPPALQKSRHYNKQGDSHNHKHQNARQHQHQHQQRRLLQHMGNNHNNNNNNNNDNNNNRKNGNNRDLNPDDDIEFDALHAVGWDQIAAASREWAGALKAMAVRYGYDRAGWQPAIPFAENEEIWL